MTWSLSCTSGGQNQDCWLGRSYYWSYVLTKRDGATLGRKHPLAVVTALDGGVGSHHGRWLWSSEMPSRCVSRAVFPNHLCTTVCRKEESRHLGYTEAFQAGGKRPNILPAAEGSTFLTHLEHGCLTHGAQVQLKRGPWGPATMAVGSLRSCIPS